MAHFPEKTKDPEKQFRQIIDLESEDFETWKNRFLQYIQDGNDSEILKIIQYAHPADIAEFLDELDEESAFYTFRLLNEEEQSFVLIELSEEKKENFLERLSPAQVQPLVSNLESDDMTSIISEYSEEEQEEILQSMDKVDSINVRDQLRFKEYTAGRLMSKQYGAVLWTDTVRQATNKLKKQAKELEDIYIIYVVDELDVLQGFIKIKDLFFAPSQQKIKKIINPSVVSVHYNTDQEEIAHLFQKYDLVSMGVVDDSGRLIGRITVDDVLDIVEEEASEDIMRLGGISEDERLNTSFFESVKRRILWLNVNLVTAVLAASVVTLFEDTITRFVALASLMPIVAGMGGNAGTQSITVVVRNIATGDLDLKNWWEAVRKELIIGLFNGFVLGILAFLFVFFVKGEKTIAFVIAIAMFINLIMAGLVGSMIPILLKKLKIDPAIASSIFVTTFTDICGFFFFLGLASLLLR